MTLRAYCEIDDGKVERDVFNAQMGRLHQMVKLAVPAPSRVSHPLSTDSLLLAGFDHSKPDRIQESSDGLRTSPMLDGTPRSYDIWCTHPDFVFVRGEVRGYLSNKTGFGRHELVEFEA